MDTATHIAYTGLVNFTTDDPTGPPSGNCLVNSLLYNEAQPLQVLLNNPAHAGSNSICMVMAMLSG